MSWWNCDPEGELSHENSGIKISHETVAMMRTALEQINNTYRRVWGRSMTTAELAAILAVAQRIRCLTFAIQTNTEEL